MKTYIERNLLLVIESPINVKAPDKLIEDIKLFLEQHYIVSWIDVDNGYAMMVEEKHEIYK